MAWPVSMAETRSQRLVRVAGICPAQTPATSTYFTGRNFGRVYSGESS